MAFALAVSLVLSTGTAEAGRHHHKKKKAKRSKPVPAMMNAAQAKAVTAFMGAFKFGMSKDDVIKVVGKQIKERYAETISNTDDVYAQDKLRRKRDKEIKRFRKSWIDFQGHKTGWDVSIIDDQFKQKTDEGMMVHWETSEGRDQRRFFFFFRGHLYKMFLALNTSAIAGAEDKGFDYFRQLMESRFGPGADINGRVEWRSKKLHAQAINKMGLYGAFCLAISDLETEGDLAAVRRANAPDSNKKDNILEAIKDNGQEPDLKSNANTIDALTKGK